MSYESLLADIEKEFSALPDKPEETPASVLRALWLWAAGTPCSAVKAVNLALPELSLAQQKSLESGIASWKNGEPLAYLVGRQHFCGLELLAGPQALIPRQETELLAKVANDVVRTVTSPHPLLVDVCTGSGNIALYLAHEFPDARVYGADLSNDAVMLARQNANALELSSRSQFYCGDLLAPFDNAEFLGKVDVITCNPPYICSKNVAQMPAEIAEHEPAMAFDGGPYGVSILQKLLSDAPRFLRPGGTLVFEVGMGQGKTIYKRAATSDAFKVVQMHEDASGQTRVISARR